MDIPWRNTIALDGAWEFAPDEHNRGLAERWFLPGASFPGAITVPGCWQAQGFYCRRAWHRRQVTIPESWRDRHVWLSFGGVSYRCELWVNGRHAGSHEGHFVPFAYDISPFVSFGQSNSVVVCVDSYDYGGLMQSEQWGEKLLGVYGCWVTWAGIYQPVSLEARGVAWIDNLFLIPDIDHKLMTAQVRLSNAAAAPLTASLLVQTGLAAGGAIASQSVPASIPAGGEATVAVSVALPGATLWEPDDPVLYQTQVSLMGDGTALDVAADRFGMRKIEVRGKQIYLNNRPIFLRGWLCDAVYPEEISPTLSEEKARRILAQCKEYGFNFVRHHTHPETPAFHRAADEAGVLQLTEFASFGSVGHPRVDPTQQTHRQIFDTWRRLIERDRNHPSIIAYGVNNECWSQREFSLWAPVYRDLYQAGKKLDPTRLIIDNSGGEDRWSAASDIYDKHTYHFPTEKEMRRITKGRNRPRPDNPALTVYKNVDLAAVAKPCLVTEVGGWSTYPDFERMRVANGGQTPWWLSADVTRNARMAYEYITRMEQGISDAGLAADYPAIIANSEHFAAMGNKLQVEEMRQTPGIEGYCYCVFQDCYDWTCGIVDNYWQVKSNAPDFATYNQASVLLWPRQRWCFWSGETMDVPLRVSYYGDTPIKHGRLSWRLRSGDQVLLSAEREAPDVACYQVQELVDLSITVPHVQQAARLTLQVTLSDGQQSLTNYWHLWAFPRPAFDPAGQTVALFDPQGRLAKAGDVFPALRPVDEAGLAAADVLVTSRMSDGVMRFLENGGRVLWLENGDEHNCRAYTSHPQIDYCATIIRSHPISSAFPNDGWCDLHFHNIIGSAVLDTGYFGPARWPALIEALQTPFATSQPLMSPFRRKGFLAEAQVGQGRLLATTFTFDGLGVLAEADSMLHTLLSYMLSPIAEAGCTLSGDDMREWAWGSPLGEQKVDWMPFQG